MTAIPKRTSYRKGTVPMLKGISLLVGYGWTALAYQAQIRGTTKPLISFRRHSIGYMALWMRQEESPLHKKQGPWSMRVTTEAILRLQRSLGRLGTSMAEGMRIHLARLGWIWQQARGQCFSSIRPSFLMREKILFQSCKPFKMPASSHPMWEDPQLGIRVLWIKRWKALYFSKSTKCLPL